MRLLGVLLVAVPFLALAAPPKVGEAGDDLLTRRRSNLLASIESLPIAHRGEVSRDKEAILVCTIGAAYSECFVVAKPHDAAKILGEDLAFAVSGTSAAPDSVEYSDEDDTAIAVAEASHGAFLSESGQNIVPVNEIADRMRSRGWDVALIARTPAYIERSDRSMAFLHGTNWNWYSAVGPVPGATVSATVRVPAAGKYAFFAFLTLPETISLVSLLAAFIYASRKSIPIERRRKLYPKLAIRPTFIGIGLHMPLAMFFLFSRGYRPYADLWLGSSSASSMMPFIALPMPILFLMIPLSQVVERRLFGQKRPDTIELPPVNNEEKALAKRVAIVGACPALLAICLMVVTDFLPKSFSGLHTAALFLLVASILGGQPAARFLYRKQLAKFAVKTDDPQLEAEARRIAFAMGTEFKSLRIEGSLIGRRLPMANVSLSGVVTVYQRSKDIFTAEEMEGLLAHELAHIKLGHVKKRRNAVIVVFAAFLLMFGSMQLALWVRLPISPLYLGLPAFILFPLSFFYARSQFGRQSEFDADLLAVETTQKPAAYASMLWKLVSNSPAPAMHEMEVGSTHPAMTKRIEAIQERARRHGFDEFNPVRPVPVES